MVYATLNEAWGNTYQIQNPNKNIANFETFHDDFIRSRSVKNENRPKYNQSIELGQTRKKNKSKKCAIKNFRDEISEISEISSNAPSEISSNESLNELKKIKNKEIKLDKNKIEHFSNLNNCNSILEHLKTCEICRNSIENDNKSIFIREFIIFASSGVLMFIFLELIAKILKK